MSDRFYAVQFRSMHTAIHSIAIFSLEQKAEELFEFMMAKARMPEEFEFPFEPCNFVDMQEINFRNPPHTCGDPDDVDSLPLVYVNFPETYIPDVYGY